MKQRRRITIRARMRYFILLALLGLVLRSAGEGGIQPRRVLILYEAGTAYPGINLVESGIRSALDTSHDKLEVYREYLETILFPDPADQARFREFILRKYRDRRPDVIITVGPSALKFMIETHEDAFSGVPIVFCLPYWVPSTLTQLDSHFTGVLNDISAGKTIQAAVKLQPETKRIIVVGGMSSQDIQFGSAVKEQLRPYEGSFDITYLTNLAMPDLLERLHHLPDHTIVYYYGLNQDAKGNRFIGGGDALSMVAAAANAPVFVSLDSFLQDGVVGGVITSFREQGRIAGELALRLLNGEKAQDIPRVSLGTIPMFDWRALRRWGIEESKLPPGSVVLNRKPTVWELYKWYIVTAISLLLSETMLISGLLWQRRRRRHTETELAVTYEGLRMAVEAGNSVGWDADLKSGRNRWFGDLQSMIGIPAVNHSGFEDLRTRVHPEDRGTFLTILSDAQQNREPYAAEFRVVRTGGDVRWISAKGKFFFAQDGEPERMLGMATDITERKLAEDALNNLNGRLIQAQEEERHRIARELHDDVLQRIAILSIDLENLAEEIGQDGDAAGKRLRQLGNLVGDLGSDLHTLSHQLHSSTLDSLGLAAALKALCEEFKDRNEIDVSFSEENVPRRIPPEVALCLFRIAQEALQNVRKHSGANKADLRLEGQADTLRLSVSDSGTGFDSSNGARRDGIGLRSMEERLRLIKGHFAIYSRPLQGTRIDAWVPVGADVKRQTTLNTGQ